MFLVIWSGELELLLHMPTFLVGLCNAWLAYCWLMQCMVWDLSIRRLLCWVIESLVNCQLQTIHNSKGHFNGQSNYLLAKELVATVFNILSAIVAGICLVGISDCSEKYKRVLRICVKRWKRSKKWKLTIYSLKSELEAENHFMWSMLLLRTVMH